MNTDILFKECADIAHDLSNCFGNEDKLQQSRNKVISLLAKLKADEQKTDVLTNALCRQVGLYPYIDAANASWEDALAKYCFSVNCGGKEEHSLHIDQSKVLKILLAGESLALSAPTSFGKSFVIDAYISIRKPKTVVIVVPTIALMDETRRRLIRKFSNEYKIITLPGEKLEEYNIFIFPQERLFAYIDDLKQIDLLVVDEFYKASDHNIRNTRTALLQKAIISASKCAKQLYYLMPNFKNIDENDTLISNVKLIKSDFSPIVLEYHELYKEKKANEKEIDFKIKQLVDIIRNRYKTLVYAGHISEIRNIYKRDEFNCIENRDPDSICIFFSEWLSTYYGAGFPLVSLVKRGVGVHNGKLHRSLCQLQVKLFEIEDGLDVLLSTSSIIEGVNTSARNVVIWSPKIGDSGHTIDYFTYCNISGRAGRMFKYFVGHVYDLVSPPIKDNELLPLEVTDDCAYILDDAEARDHLSNDQKEKVKSLYQKMEDLVIDKDELRRKLRSGAINMPALDFAGVLETMKDSHSWPKLRSLNNIRSLQPKRLDSLLYYLISIKFKGRIDKNPIKLQSFIAVLIGNWNLTYNSVLSNANTEVQRILSSKNKTSRVLKIGDFSYSEAFELERYISYQFVSLVSDFNEAYNLTHEGKIDITRFLYMLSHAFLPANVYFLEEYGLPRYLSKKIHDSGVIDLEREDVPISEVICAFLEVTQETIISSVGNFSIFEKFILRSFYQGISYEK